MWQKNLSSLNYISFGRGGGTAAPRNRFGGAWGLGLEGRKISLSFLQQSGVFGKVVKRLNKFHFTNNVQRSTYISTRHSMLIVYCSIISVNTRHVFKETNTKQNVVKQEYAYLATQYTTIQVIKIKIKRLEANAVLLWLHDERC